LKTAKSRLNNGVPPPMPTRHPIVFCLYKSKLAQSKAEAANILKGSESLCIFAFG